MSSLFWLIIGLSLAGGVTCLIVFAVLAPIKNRLIKSWQFYLLLIVLLRFLIPIPLNLPFSIPQLKPVSDFISAAVIIPQVSPAEAEEIAAQPQYSSEKSSAAVSAPNTSSESLPAQTANSMNVIQLLPFIWLAGVAGLFSWSVGGYLMTIRRMKQSRSILIPGHIPVYESGSITTPIAAGLFRPAIYLPKGYGFGEMAVRHELCHLRRGDLWLKWLLQLVVCIHWFNPLAYLLKRELNRLIELSCDSSVARFLSQPERKIYGIMLLDAAQAVSDKGGLLVASLGKDKRLLQERLKEIMKSKTATRKSIAAMSVLVVVVLCTALLSGALLAGCTASAQGLMTSESTADMTDVSDANFVSDPEILGTWESVGAVANIDNFDPASISDQGDFLKMQLVFAPDGKVNFPVWSWSKGVIHMHNANVSQSYTIKEISGTKYMFFNALITKPTAKYIVLKCTSASTDFNNIVDNIDLPFVDDPAVIGTWKSVDFVRNIQDFNPAKLNWPNGLYLKSLTFHEGGSMGASSTDGEKLTIPGITWTNGIVLSSYNKTASAYEIKEIGGSTYLFYEWKSGDYVFLHMKPQYYVLEKAN